MALTSEQPDLFGGEAAVAAAKPFDADAIAGWKARVREAATAFVNELPPRPAGDGCTDEAGNYLRMAIDRIDEDAAINAELAGGGVR